MDIRTIAWLISSGSEVNHGDAYASSTATKHRCFSRPAPIPNRHSRTRANVRRRGTTSERVRTAPNSEAGRAMIAPRGAKAFVSGRSLAIFRSWSLLYGTAPPARGREGGVEGKRGDIG